MTKKLKSQFRSDLVVFLESTELRVKNRNDLAIHYWRNNVNLLFSFNDYKVLQGGGTVSQKEMEGGVGEHYQSFDARRKARGCAGGSGDFAELERMEKVVQTGK